MMRLRTCTILLLVLAIAASSVFAAKPVLVGIYHPLSGPSAYCGQSAVNGALLAIDEINKAGGVIGGRELKLIVEDNENDVTATVNVVRKLLVQDRVSALIGDYFSSCTLAGMELAARYKVPDVCGISASPQITSMGNQWIFRTCTTDAMNAAAYVKFMVEEKGYKKFLFMANDGEFGLDAVTAYKPFLNQYNASIVGEMYFSELDVDFRSQITKIKEINPEVIVLVSGGAAGALFCKQARELGEDAVIMGLGTQSDQEFIDTAGIGAEGVYCATTYVHTIDTPENDVFVEKYTKRYTDFPNEYSLSGYRNVYVVKEAIERAGKDDPTAIRDALRKTDYLGISGPIQFDADGQSYPWVFITQIIDGKLTIAKKAQTFKVE